MHVKRRLGEVRYQNRDRALLKVGVDRQRLAVENTSFFASVRFSFSELNFSFGVSRIRGVKTKNPKIKPIRTVLLGRGNDRLPKMRPNHEEEGGFSVAVSNDHTLDVLHCSVFFFFVG